MAAHQRIFSDTILSQVFHNFKAEIYLLFNLFASGRTSSYPGGVLGMAFVGTVCSAASSGGINVVRFTPF